MFGRKKRRPQLKSVSEIESMKEAGRVSALVLEKLGELIEPGISTLELDAFAENLIRSEGGKPAFKGYGGFPGSICASIDEMVVHGIPSADVVLQEGHIISIDTGAIIDGWVGDNAYTYPVGRVDDEKARLMKATEEAMWAGIAVAVPGNKLGDIGYAVQYVAESQGFGVVRDYVGHGVGHAMHEPPQVPNYGLAGKGMKLEEGLVIAIEPMVTAGTYNVHTLRDGWGVVTDDARPAAHFEKTIAVTAEGPLVLTSC